MLAWAFIAGTPGGADRAFAAAETFNTALPVAAGEFIFREQFLYRRASNKPGTAERDLELTGGISVLGYGATSDLALFGALPWLEKRLEVTDPAGQRVERRSSGIGDAQVFGRYTIVQRDTRGRNFRVAPFLGLELPSGENDDTDRFGTLPAPLQPGSGSWDPFGGVIATWQTLAYQIDAQVGYKANTEATGFEFGDEFRVDVSFQYRLWPRELGEGVPAFLYGVIEANFLHQARNRSAGVVDADSGGTTLLLSPGLQYVTRRLVVEGIVQLPAEQNLNGSALEDDFVFRGGFRVNF